VPPGLMPHEIALSLKSMKRLLLSLAIIFCITNVLKAQEVRPISADELMRRVQAPDTLFLVNFWATWCGPCVKELPEIKKLSEGYKNRPVKVILVSLDFPEDFPKKVEKFIRKKKINDEVLWLSDSNPNQFMPKLDPTWQGSIPATLIIYNKREYRNFLEGTISAKQVSLIIDRQLGW
jgi:thiol-disulfide isomerase/thioredoxin